MRSRTIVRMLAVSVLVWLAVAACAPAHAAEWSPPVAGCVIVTPYGVSCASGTHRGVDLAAAAGAEAASPASGVITFAGRVPADGGGTCGAVTIELGDGLRVSLLPLGDVFVTAGDQVGAGEVVGTVADRGDDSCPGPHLHLGLRRGDTYLDPTGFLPIAGGGHAAEPPADLVPATPGTDPLVGQTAASAAASQAQTVITNSTAADAVLSAGTVAVAEPLAGDAPVTQGGEITASAMQSESEARPGDARAASMRARHTVLRSADLPVPSALAVAAPAGAGWRWWAVRGVTLPAGGLAGFAAVYAGAAVLVLIVARRREHAAGACQYRS